MTSLPSENHPSMAASSAPGLSAGMTILFGFACGALAANLYYAQPLVALIGRDVGLSPSTESAIVTASQVGYAVGLLALVPLGDIVESRKLIILTMAANIASLLGLALAPGLFALFAMTLIVGVTSTAAQMLVPLAASLAAPESRGRVVGNVMSGLLGGILFARPASSFLADLVGWRGVFLTSAGVVTALLLAGLLLFPSRRPTQVQSYGALIASLGRLFVAEPLLRKRALYHAAMFGSFSLFWTAAPIVLLGPDHRLTPSGVALFALSGVLGVFAAPVAGRLADRGLSRIGTIGAMSLAILGFAIALGGTVASLVAAGILIDLGVQANLVIGQREIFTLDASIRNRLNALYMATFFAGGALGSALTSPVLQGFGWIGICALGMAFPGAALAYLVFGDRASKA